MKYQYNVSNPSNYIISQIYCKCCHGKIELHITTGQLHHMQLTLLTTLYSLIIINNLILTYYLFTILITNHCCLVSMSHMQTKIYKYNYCWQFTEVQNIDELIIT